MNWISIAIAVAIAIAAVGALISMKRKKGGCSGCSGNCAECMKRFEEERV